MQNFPTVVLEQIRVRLEAEKQKISARIDELTAQDPFSDPDRINDNAASDTEATEESSHDRYLAMVEETKAQLASIDDALIRIGSGKYGYCTNCENMIDTDRLAILPAATLCLTCEKTKKSLK